MPFKDKEKEKEYQKKYKKEYYRKNKKDIYEKKLQRARENREWIRELKSSMKCVGCGEDCPDCLDFHHKDNTKKELEIGKCVQYGWSRKRILKEIEKCVTLCANCHRKLHAGIV